MSSRDLIQKVQLPSSFQHRAINYNPFANHQELETSVPSTEAQREIWSSVLIDSQANPAFNESITIHFSGKLDFDQAKIVINHLIQRHQSLRATFSSDGASLCVYRSITVQVPIDDLSRLPDNEKSLAFDHIKKNEMTETFDLLNGPLVRFRILKLAENRFALLLTAHHIICDGWSLGVLLEEFCSLYHSQIDNTSQQDKPLSALKFTEYASLKWNDNRSPSPDLNYWKKIYQTIPDPIELPLKATRPIIRTFKSRRVDFKFDQTWFAQVKQFSGRQRISISSFFMMCYGLCLSRLSRQDDLVIGMPAAGQSFTGMTGLVGHCVNLLPIRWQFDWHKTIRDCLEDAKNLVLDAYEHQQVTFGQLIKELPLVRSENRIPLVSVLFNYDKKLKKQQLSLKDLAIDYEANPRIAENFEIFMNLVEGGETLHTECQYNTDLFSEELITNLCHQIQMIASQVIAKIDRPAREIHFDFDQEIHRWNQTEVAWPNLQRIDQWVANHGENEKVAIITKDAELSFRELHHRSNILAKILLEKGIRPKDAVGVMMDRHLNLPVALLGILKVGALYVPLDPKFPSKRLEMMVEDSGLKLILSDQKHGSTAQSYHQHLDTDKIDWTQQDPSDFALDPQISLEDPAYMIFTSGSTGRPKGVLISHLAASNFLRSMAEAPGLKSQDRLMAVTTISFDISVLEIFLPLVQAASLYLASHDEILDIPSLISAMDHHRITILQATPSLWRLLISQGFRPSTPSFKGLCGGEALSDDLAKELLQRSIEVWNMYGPTETTVWSSIFKVQAGQAILIGHPIANTKIMMLDQTQNPLPQEVWGEIAIAGTGLAIGYQNREDLTREKFITTKWSQEKWYLTGDLGRYRRDGSIEIRGRIDHQVKIRGFRIELDEIKLSLEQHIAIKEAIIMVQKIGPDDERLVAYYEADHEINQTELRNLLLSHLPPYMIPQHFIFVQTIPRLPNGKVNRAGLPAIEESSERPVTKLVDMKQSPVEAVLRRLWEKHLQSPLQSRDDHFFLQGGHSLIAVQLVADLNQELKRNIKIHDLFRYSRFRDLLQLLESSSSVKQESIPVRKEGDFRPSLWQLRMWYIEQLDPETKVHNLPAAWKFIGKLNPAAFQAAFQNLIEDYDALKMSLMEQDGDIIQVTHNPDQYRLAFEDLANDPDSEGKVIERLKISALEKIPVDQFPLFRACLFKIKAEEWIFYFMANHIIWDGWCFDLFLDKLDRYYRFTSGRDSTRPRVPSISYGDYCSWHRDQINTPYLKDDQQYWQKKYTTIPEPLDIPTDFPRPAEFRAFSQTLTYRLDAAQTKALDESARFFGITPFMMLMGAYALMLSRYSEQYDIVIANPVRGRERQELEELLGVFINVIPLRFQFSENSTVSQFINEIKENCVDGLAHSKMPFDHLLTLLNLPRDPSRTPLFSAMFSFQDVSRRQNMIGSLDSQQIFIPNDQIHTDLMIWAKKSPEYLEGGLDFRVDLWKEGNARAMLDCFLSFLHELTSIKNLEQGIQVLNPMSHPVRQELLKLSHGAKLSVSPVPSLIQRLDAHAQFQPSKKAIWFKDDSLSYLDLQQKSATIAHKLKLNGIGHGQLVGICMERQINLVPIMIGILRSGAAYVPLDPKLPQDRISYMVEDAKISAVITDRNLADRFFSLPLQVFEAIDLLRVNETDISERREDLSMPSDRQAAYVIYTSGSTGNPKGVVISHHALNHFLCSIQQTIQLSQRDHLLAMTTISFDISILEIFLPLFEGATLTLISDADHEDPQRIAEMLNDASITWTQATPATWQNLKVIEWQGRQDLKILCGGEALSRDLAQYLSSRVGTFWNVYGPTEATVWATAYEVKPERPDILIGTPLPGYEAYILDSNLALLPIGAKGHLYLGGPSLANGYLNRPEITTERYLEHSAFGRIYQTGDLARWQANHQIEYLGRSDFQVKIRGFRIELGEIENRLESHPGIQQAIVTVKEVNRDDRRLVAYIREQKSPQQRQEIDLQTVHQFLSQFLPTYMLPNHLVILDQFPLTGSGKIDRKKLPAPVLDVNPKDHKRLPETASQKLVAATFQKHLQIEVVTLDDRFFELGGHSLLAIKAISELNQSIVGAKKLLLRHFLLENVEEIARIIEQNTTSREANSSSNWLERVFKWRPN